MRSVFIRAARPVATVFVLAVAVAALWGAERDRSAASELVFLLQYIGSDYGVAVHDGRVVDEVEHAEMRVFSARVLDLYRDLSGRPAIRAELERLQQRIQGLAPWEEVRALCQALVPRIVDELEVPSVPDQPPDMERGRRLYAEDCLPCHGAFGGGDGRASAGMVPAPTSFRDARMNLLSPHQMWNATLQGIPGTAMPAYAGALSPQEAWDVAFFLLTLREGFDPRAPADAVPVSVRELATRSNEELLAQLRTSRPQTGLREVDYYRDQRPRTESSSAGIDPDLEQAERLERAFSRVADRVFPSVVGVTVFKKDGAAPAQGPGPEGWREGDDVPVYPGYHPTRSASGFVVSEDGDILTSASLFMENGAVQKPGLIDVEIGEVHCQAKLVGVEPTVDLAVLSVAPPIPLQPAALADSDRVRVGQWAIAVGDPSGAARYFAPGTIAARPERDCYQEHRTSTLLQSSATLAPEGFGGPLVDIRGEVIGLTVPGPAGVNALPMNLALTLYRALKVKESSLSPWLGIAVLDLSAALRRTLSSAPLTGIYIEDVFEPSPASRAGIRAGDVLTAMDGNRILAVADFQRWLYLLGVDATVELEIVREGKTLREKVRIEQRPPSATMR